MAEKGYNTMEKRVLRIKVSKEKSVLPLVLGIAVVVLIAAFIALWLYTSSVQTVTGGVIISGPTGISFSSLGFNSVVVNVDAFLSDGSIGLLYLDNSRTTFAGMGSSSSSKLVTSASNELILNHGNNERYFVVSWQGANRSESYYFEYRNIGSDASTNITTIRNVKSGQEYNMEVGDSNDIGEIKLTVNSAHKNTQVINLTISRSGSLGDVYFNRLYDTSGNYVVLPLKSQLPSSTYDFSVYDKDGALIQKYRALIAGLQPRVDSVCYDSDNIDSFGITRGFASKGQNYLNDICVSGEIVNESGCTNGNVVYTSYNCSSRNYGDFCQEGFCVSPQSSCKDSVNAGGTEYSLKLAGTNATAVKISVNGVESGWLNEGAVTNVSSLYLKIQNILYNGKSEDIGVDLSSVDIYARADSSFAPSDSLIRLKAGGCGAIDGCYPNWTARNTSCQSGSLVNYGVDLNSCNSSSGRPSNATLSCTLNQEGIGLLGTRDSIAVHGVSVDLKINDELVNYSRNYSGMTRKVSVFDKSSNKSIFDFNWNFSRTLDLSSIFVQKQHGASPARGYAVVNGLEFNKTVYVDKLSDFSTGVCIRDENDSSASRISEWCDDDDEILLDCPGDDEGYYCDIVSGRFKVTGVRHSAVMEFVEPGLDDTPCTPEWQCGNWSGCVNNRRSRTCSDINYCYDLTGKPTLNESCYESLSNATGQAYTTNSYTPPVKCVWQCTPWAPSACPSDTKTQSRTCTEKSGCGVVSDKPAENKTCTPGKADTVFYVIIVIISLAILVIIGIIVYVLLHKKPISTEDSGSLSPNLPSTPPSNPPSAPVQPVQRPFQQGSPASNPGSSGGTGFINPGYGQGTRPF
jgi:hypothetical protein